MHATASPTNFPIKAQNAMKRWAASALAGCLIVIAGCCGASTAEAGDDAVPTATPAVNKVTNKTTVHIYHRGMNAEYKGQVYPENSVSSVLLSTTMMNEADRKNGGKKLSRAIEIDAKPGKMGLWSINPWSVGRIIGARLDARGDYQKNLWDPFIDRGLTDCPADYEVTINYRENCRVELFDFSNHFYRRFYPKNATASTTVYLAGRRVPELYTLLRTSLDQPGLEIYIDFKELREKHYKGLFEVRDRLIHFPPIAQRRVVVQYDPADVNEKFIRFLAIKKNKKYFPFSSFVDYDTGMRFFLRYYAFAPCYEAFAKDTSARCAINRAKKSTFDYLRKGFPESKVKGKTTDQLFAASFARQWYFLVSTTNSAWNPLGRNSSIWGLNDLIARPFIDGIVDYDASMTVSSELLRYRSQPKTLAASRRSMNISHWVPRREVYIPGKWGGGPKSSVVSSRAVTAATRSTRTGGNSATNIMKPRT